MSNASSSAAPSTAAPSTGAMSPPSPPSSGSGSATAVSKTADDLRNAKFATGFRGYDTAEVRAFLQRMATRVETELGLGGRVGMSPITGFTPIAVTPTALSDEVELVLNEAAYLAATNNGAGSASQSSQSSQSAVASPSADEVLTAARNEYETILASARNEANAIVSKANDDAARIILRARAESRGKSSADSSAVVEAAYAQAASDPEMAREQARLMIAEARAVRERILTDLNKRRRVAHVQLEQLRVAREKLTETLREARRIVDDSARDLSTAEVEARLAADAAGRRISAEALPSIGELEVELWGGRHMPSTPTFASSSTPSSDADDRFEKPLAPAVSLSSDQGEVLGTPSNPLPQIISVSIDEATAFIAAEVPVESAAVVETAEVVESAENVAGVANAAMIETAMVETAKVVETAEVVQTDEELVGVASLEPSVLLDAQPDLVTDADSGNEQDVSVVTALRSGEAVPPAAPVEQELEASKKRPANVDDLFARLRADRERAAQQARSVLGSGDSNSTAPSKPASKRTTNDADEVTTSAVLDLRPDDGSTRSKGAKNPGHSDRGNGGRSDSGSSAQANDARSGGVALKERQSLDADSVRIVVDLRPSDPSQVTLAPTPTAVGVPSTRAEPEHTVLEVDDGLDFVVGPLHGSLIRMVKRRLHDEQSSILAMLRSSRGPLDVDRLLGSTEVHQLRLSTEIRPIFVDAFRVGAQKSSGVSMSDLEILELIGEHIESVTVSVTSIVRSEVSIIVIDQGTSDTRALGEALTSAYRLWTTERIGTVVSGAVFETYRLGTAA